jgi:hypothetical protein
MKPVSDPNLLAQLESQSGGPPAPIKRGPVTDPALLAQLEGGPKLSAQGQAYRVGGGGAEAPAWYEELGGGLKHSLDKSALGLEKSVKWAANKLPGVNWEVNPENVENVQRGKEFVKGTGALSTVGEVGGDLLQGAAVGGAGALAGAGRVLPAAVDIATQAGWGALTAPEDKGEAAAWGAGGAAAGRAIPHVVGALRKGAQMAGDYVVPARRAAGQLEKHLGKEGFTQAGEAVKKGLSSGDSVLPQTTAAMADNVKLAGLEKGARGRGLVDFSGHEAAVDAAKQTALTKLTGAADNVGSLSDEAASVVAEGKRRLRNMPLGVGRKQDVVGALDGLRATEEVISSPEAKGAIKKAIDAINDPNSSTLILTELRDEMASRAAKNPKLEPIRQVLMEAANERSKNIASAAEEGAGAIKGQLQAAQASKKLRGEYLDQGAKLKDINELSLNKSLTRSGLDEDTVAGGRKLSDALRKGELYKTSAAPTEIDKGILGNINPLTKLAAKASRAYASNGVSLATDVAQDILTHMSKKSLDEAVARPESFLKMVQAKQARGATLAAWEKNLAKSLRSATVAGGVAGREIGE